MNKVLSALLLVSMFAASSAFGACHSCEAWSNNRNKVTKKLAKAWCRVKRGFTGRTCCTKNCSENYQASLSKTQEDLDKSFALCEECARHHICNTCKTAICETHSVCHACEKVAEEAKAAEVAETEKN